MEGKEEKEGRKGRKEGREEKEGREGREEKEGRKGRKGKEGREGGRREDEVTGKSTACCKSEGWDGWVGGWSEGRRDERRGVGHGGARRGRECDDASQAWAC